MQKLGLNEESTESIEPKRAFGEGSFKRRQLNRKENSTGFSA